MSAALTPHAQPLYGEPYPLRRLSVPRISGISGADPNAGTWRHWSSLVVPSGIRFEHRDCRNKPWVGGGPLHYRSGAW